MNKPSVIQKYVTDYGLTINMLQKISDDNQ